MKHRTLVPVLIALSVNVSRAQNAVAPPGSAAEYARQLMDREVAFEQMVPSGMSIEAKEVSRSGKSGADLVVQYHIYIKGAPQNALFRQVSWPVNADKPSTVMEGISIGKDGVLECAGRSPGQCGDASKPDDPIEFTFGPAKGEPYRIAFISDKVRIGLVIVPDRIDANDRGCSLDAVRLTPKFEFAFLSGSGYAPNAAVHYRVSSSDVTNSFIVQADEQGTIRTGLIPYTKGKTGGTTNVKIVEARCSA